MTPDKIGVLVIHGMGSQDSTFAYDMIAELKKRLKPHADRFVWEPIFWARKLMDREAGLLEKLGEAQDPDGRRIWLEWHKTREFVFHNFGDAVAYHREREDGEPTSVYHDIHRIVDASVRRLKAQLPSPDSPIVVMAHSLGAHIMSNYIWDHQPDSAGEVHGDYEPLPSVAAMITFGCNIPLFSLSFETATPIDLPGAGVTKPELVKASRWLNFLDVDDVLGWPLRPLYEKDRAKLKRKQQEETVDRIEDHAINVGAVLQSWNPLAHGKYWEDDDFTIPSAAYLSKLREALDA